MKHLLSIESLSAAEIEEILGLGLRLKALRGKARHPRPLRGQTWALIFGKSSTRTRVSFEVGIHELGGTPLFLGMHDLQLGRGESVEDTARVLSRYVHGVAIRTYAQKEVETFARVGSIPVVNALTDDEHPCQILADLMTWAEVLVRQGQRAGRGINRLFRGRTVAFLGDAGCNVARSWVFAAAKLGFHLNLAAPAKYLPEQRVLGRIGSGVVTTFRHAVEAARDADLLYTDTWISMGKEREERRRLRDLAPYQINDKVVAAARKGAPVMHCLPAYRGNEISAEVFEANERIIFDEAENRLHVQKAVMALLADRLPREALHSGS